MPSKIAGKSTSLSEACREVETMMPNVVVSMYVAIANMQLGQIRPRLLLCRDQSFRAIFYSGVRDGIGVLGFCISSSMRPANGPAIAL